MSEVKKTAKVAFENATRGSVYSFNPLDLAIMGGADTLPENERGPLDTPTDKSHPLYDERLKLKLSPEWVNNIKLHGVKETINIVKIGSVPFVVNGRQRVRGARAANFHREAEGIPPMKVAAMLVRVDDLGMLRDMITLNIHHEDSTATKIAKLKRVLDRGVSVEDAATYFAIKTATAKAWLQYDDTAIAAVKAAVNSGKIPHTMGADIARLPEDKQQAALDEILATAVADKADRPQRSGKGSKATRIVKRHANPDKSPGIGDKKTMKKFLEAVESAEHKNANDKTLAWWDGVEAALHLVLGADGADKRLIAILNALE